MKIKQLVIIILLVVLHQALPAQNTPAPIPYLDFVLTPDHDDWNYKMGEEAIVKVSVLHFGVPVKSVTLEYEFGPEMLPSEKKGHIIFENGTGELAIGTLNAPGFKQLKIKTSFENQEYRDQVKLAFSPEQIEPTVALPDDFSEFWNNARAEIASVPLDAHQKYRPELSTTTVDVFLVDFKIDKKGKRLYGYLAKPKTEGKFPVLLCPPGAGIKPVSPYTGYADQGFISLNIEIHGISPEVDVETYKSISAAFGDYWQFKLDDRDNYYYKSVYLGCTRAIDFLCSLPEFDGKNVVVTGGSQGGALSIVTTALDRRVTCLAAFYPALCDMTGYLHGRAGGWPHIFSEKYAKITATPVNIKNAAYFDVVNFARQIQVPGFYSFGYNDNTCPPTSTLSAINQIKAAKTIVITPISGHWRFEGTNRKSIGWIKDQLR